MAVGSEKRRGRGRTGKVQLACARVRDRLLGRRLLEEPVEMPDGKERAEKLVNILSEAVWAHLKRRAQHASKRHSGARRIELTAGESRAGIGHRMRMREATGLEGKATI